MAVSRSKINEIWNIIKASDQTRAAFQSAGANARRFGKEAESATSRMGKAMKTAALQIFGVTAAIQGLRAAYKEVSAFQTASADLIKVTTEPIEAIQKRILELPPILGSATELIQGYYQVLSAGVTEPAAAMNVLKVASMAAAAAHVDQGEVIKGLTKFMKGFEGQIQSTIEASDLLFAIEKEGQTNFQELIPVIGGLAKISRQLTVDQNELSGALALMTQTAANTDEAATQYKALMISMLKPADALRTQIRAMGFDSVDLAIKQMGLVDVLRSLQESTGGSSQKLAELFGNQRALLGFTSLAANGFADLEEKITAVGEAAGTTEKAFREWATTSEAMGRVFENTLKNEVIEVLMDLAPAINFTMKLATAGILTIRVAYEGLKQVFLLLGGIITAPFVLFENALNGFLDLTNKMMDNPFLKKGMDLMGMKFEKTAWRSTLFNDTLEKQEELFWKAGQAGADAAKKIQGLFGDTDFGLAVEPPPPPAPDEDPRVEQEKLTQAQILRIQQEAMLASLETEKAFDANLESIHQDQVARKQEEIELEKDQAQARVTAISSLVTGLGAAARASNASFEVQKKIAIAQALVGTYQATVDAYKSAGNPYLGAVLAALAFATNIAKVNAIKRTKPGSSGGAAGSTGGALPSQTAAGAVPAAPLNQQLQQPEQVIILEITGDIDADMIAAKVIPGLKKFAERGTFPTVQVEGAN